MIFAISFISFFCVISSAQIGDTFSNFGGSSENISVEIWTLFWELWQVKVDHFLNENQGFVEIDPDRTKPMTLSASEVAWLRNLTITNYRNKKISEGTGYNSQDIFRVRNDQQRVNLTCSRMVADNCTFTIAVPYWACSRANIPRSLSDADPACIVRYRQEVRNRSCFREVTSCCKGYILGADNYCTRIEMEEAESGCGGSRDLTENSGVIASPNYPNKYTSGLDCKWRITVPTSHAVIIKFMDFDIERPIGFCDFTSGECMFQCQFDVMQVRHQLINYTQVFCGYLLPERELVYGEGRVDLVFRSDSSVERRGFKIAYDIVQVSRLRRHQCNAGQSWSLCRRKCRLTCEDASESLQLPWKICFNENGDSSLVDAADFDDLTCQPGCSCPSERPIWHRGRCIKLEGCEERIFQCGSPIPAVRLKILGGEDAEDGSWPWMVQLSRNDLRANCAGSLICSDWVVTAAHCFLDKLTWTMPDVIDRRLFWFHIGKYWINVQQDDRRVESYRASRIIIHPDYNFTTDVNDIALVKLNGYARQWDKIRPICLPEILNETILSEEDWARNGGFPRVGQSCTATGWGFTRDGGFGSYQLKEVELEIQETSRCQYRNHTIEWRTTICAGGSMEADTCRGDSGGPYMCNLNGLWQINGITSFGENCGRGFPGGYTRISNYVRWIKGIVGQDCNL